MGTEIWKDCVSMIKSYVYAFNLDTNQYCVVDLLSIGIGNRSGWYKHPISIEAWTGKEVDYALIPYEQFVEQYGELNYP